MKLKPGIKLKRIEIHSGWIVTLKSQKVSEQEYGLLKEVAVIWLGWGGEVLRMELHRTGFECWLMAYQLNDLG